MTSMFNLFLLVILLRQSSCKAATQDHTLSYNASLIHNITRLLDTILLNQDRNFRPLNGDPEAPLQVEIDISVRSMGPISEQQMEFSMDCYFRQKWLDRRLAFDSFGSRENLPIASKMLKDIWTPDTYIRNGRHSYLHTLTVPNVLFRVRYDGQVHVSQRLTIRTRCKMFFKKFPMDSQLRSSNSACDNYAAEAGFWAECTSEGNILPACPIEIGSLGYFSKDVVYVWKDVELDSKMSNMLAQYQLLHVVKTSHNLSSAHDSHLNMSVLKVYFKLQRQQGFYILQIYTPCTLIVVMSWVSFWINKESSPARVALGIMTVLSMSTLGFGSRTDLPKVSHSTALDIYIISCFGFVFAAMIEYAIINYANIVYIRKKYKFFELTFKHDFEFVVLVDIGGLQVHDLKGLKSSDAMASMRIFSASLMGSVQCDSARNETMALSLKLKPWYRRLFTHKENRSVLYRMALRAAKAKEKLKMKDPTNAVSRIDSASKIVFPTLYILFNVIYWLAFLYWIPDEISALI